MAIKGLAPERVARLSALVAELRPMLATGTARHLTPNGKSTSRWSRN